MASAGTASGERTEEEPPAPVPGGSRFRPVRVPVREKSAPARPNRPGVANAPRRARPAPRSGPCLAGPPAPLRRRRRAVLPGVTGRRGGFRARSRRAGTPAAGAVSGGCSGWRGAIPPPPDPAAAVGRALRRSPAVPGRRVAAGQGRGSGAILGRLGPVPACLPPGYAGRLADGGRGWSAVRLRGRSPSGGGGRPKCQATL